MSNKMTCPACDSHTSAIYMAYQEERPCPYCGLPFDAAKAVLDAARRGADAELTRRYQEAEIRAGKAEAEARQLRAHLDAIRRAVEKAPEFPEW